ncbi:hypothetical protein JTB14_032803 [Gonioctena quinquepunctata]|nr:hypothetical protein JTB14_032803 [Gonioctena quinquepunctata]
MKLHKECQADPATKLDEAYTRARNPKGSPNFGAHVLCIFVKSGIMNENGDVNIENMRRVISRGLSRDPTGVDQMVKKCGKPVETTALEAAIALEKCFHTYDIRKRIWEV